MLNFLFSVKFYQKTKRVYDHKTDQKCYCELIVNHSIEKETHIFEVHKLYNCDINNLIYGWKSSNHSSKSKIKSLSKIHVTCTQVIV